jgi:hypothetical protein
MTRQEITIGTWHFEDILQLSFCRQKEASKHPAGHYLWDFPAWINVLKCSDPFPLPPW